MNSNIFDEHGISEYFETSDGLKFYTEHDAKAHAKDLEIKTVKKVSKSDVVQPSEKAPEKDAGITIPKKNTGKNTPKGK